jgi:hypothetical protein
VGSHWLRFPLVEAAQVTVRSVPEWLTADIVRDVREAMLQQSGWLAAGFLPWAV